METPLTLTATIYSKSSTIFDRLSLLKEKISQFENYEDFLIADEDGNAGIEDWREFINIFEYIKGIRVEVLAIYKENPYKDRNSRQRFARRNIALRRTIAMYEEFIKSMENKFPLLGCRIKV